VYPRKPDVGPPLCNQESSHRYIVSDQEPSTARFLLSSHYSPAVLSNYGNALTRIWIAKHSIVVIDFIICNAYLKLFVLERNWNKFGLISTNVLMPYFQSFLGGLPSH